MCSLTSEEFQQMVSDIRRTEQALGYPHKQFLSCEKACFEKLGKSIVAARNLSSGQILSESDIKLKVSYPNGIPAKDLDFVVGAELIKNVEEDEPISEDHLKIEY